MSVLTEKMYQLRRWNKNGYPEKRVDVEDAITVAEAVLAEGLAEQWKEHDPHAYDVSDPDEGPDYWRMNGARQAIALIARGEGVWNRLARVVGKGELERDGV